MTDSDHERLASLYGFELPSELFAFWKFASELKPENPRRAFWQLGADVGGYILTGPFDVLAGALGEPPWLSPILHERWHPYPPELFTVWREDFSGERWCLWMEEEPRADAVLPVFRVWLRDRTEPLTFEAASLFDAMKRVLRRRLEDESSDGIEAVLERMAAPAEEWRGRASPWEKRQPIAATLDRLGVVAPKDSYRPLTVSDEEAWDGLLGLGELYPGQRMIGESGSWPRAIARWMPASRRPHSRRPHPG